jgi:hypothetical protein
VEVDAEEPSNDMTIDKSADEERYEDTMEFVEKYKSTRKRMNWHDCYAQLKQKTNVIKYKNAEVLRVQFNRFKKSESFFFLYPSLLLLLNNIISYRIKHRYCSYIINAKKLNDLLRYSSDRMLPQMIPTMTDQAITIHFQKPTKSTVLTVSRAILMIFVEDTHGRLG